jgi:hypothetical protein
VKLPRTNGESATRRRSPKHPGVIDVFSELVSFPELMAHANFQLDIVLTEEEAVWRFDGPKRWRRRGWVTVERRLLRVYETVSLRCADDYVAMLPPGLPEEFATADIAEALRRPRFLAQKVAYCLRNGGVIEQVGARGNALVYAKVCRE